MKKVILLLALALGGFVIAVGGIVGLIVVTVVVIRRLLPSDFRQRLLKLPGRMMKWMMDHSGVHQIQEQNEQILAVLRERLPAEESASQEPPSSNAEPQQD